MKGRSNPANLAFPSRTPPQPMGLGGGTVWHEIIGRVYFCGWDFFSVSLKLIFATIGHIGFSR